MKASSNIRHRLDAANRAAFDALAEDYAARHAGRIIGLKDFGKMCVEYRAFIQRLFYQDRDRLRMLETDLLATEAMLAGCQPIIEDLPGVPQEHIDRLPKVLLSREGIAALFQAVRQAVFRQVHDPADRRTYDDEADRIFRRYFDERERGDE